MPAAPGTFDWAACVFESGLKQLLTAPLVTRRVLEVGCGKGHCTLFLAGLCRDVQFEGVDIVQRHVDAARADALRGAHTNASFSLQDFLALDEQATYDCIFGCESLCHMDDAAKVQAFATKAQRVLRPGGRVVIVDGFRASTFDSCSPEQRQAMLLAESGFRINKMPSVQDWKEAFAPLGFRVATDTDYTDEVLPFWTTGWRVARGVMLFPWLVRLLCRSSKRKETLSNLVAVMFTAHAMSSGAAHYGMLVLERI